MLLRHLQMKKAARRAAFSVDGEAQSSGCATRPATLRGNQATRHG
jgi:hypothetical protein